MVEGGQLATAELAYQRALSTLHEARAALSELAAARRRFAYDRAWLAPEQAVAGEAELEAEQERLVAQAEQLRQLAADLRVEVRRLAGHAGAEPDVVPEEAPLSGYQQPPFLERDR